MEEIAAGESAGAVPIDRGLVALPDGRSIAWTAFGAREGAVVIGQPHTGDSGDAAMSAYVAPLALGGIRLVEVCRAGLGPSTRRPGRTEQTDAEDMLRIIDDIGVDCAHLIGECGGTGATLALAARWPSRVQNVALVSPMAPSIGPDADSYVSDGLRYMRRSFRFGPIARWLARGRAKAFIRDPEAFLDRVSTAIPAVDRPFTDDPEWRAISMGSLSQFYASPEPYVDEWRSVLGPWSFDISDIRCPVVIHHGELDATAPVAMARWLAGLLPAVDLQVDPDLGHFFPPDRFASILKMLAAAH